MSEVLNFSLDKGYLSGWKPNQNVLLKYINNSVIVTSGQNTSTPGIRNQIYNLPLCKTIEIEAEGYCDTGNAFLWAYVENGKQRLTTNYTFLPKTLGNVKTTFQVPFIGANEALHFGVLFTGPEISQSFVLKKMVLSYVTNCIAPCTSSPQSKSNHNQGNGVGDIQINNNIICQDESNGQKCMEDQHKENKQNKQNEEKQTQEELEKERIKWKFIEAEEEELKNFSFHFENDKKNKLNKNPNNNETTKEIDDEIQLKTQRDLYSFFDETNFYNENGKDNYVCDEDDIDKKSSSSDNELYFLSNEKSEEQFVKDIERTITELITGDYSTSDFVTKSNELFDHRVSFTKPLFNSIDSIKNSPQRCVQNVHKEIKEKEEQEISNHHELRNYIQSFSAY